MNEISSNHELDRIPRLRDEELAKALKMLPKDLRKECAQLSRDGVIKINSKVEEIKEYRHTKRITRAYYYIDYLSFVNVIKYRMYKIQEMIQSEVDSQNKNRCYVCPLCRTRYDPMAALSLARPEDGLFACEICQNVLELEAGEDVENDLSKRFNTERRPILELLQHTELFTIPEFIPNSTTTTTTTIAKDGKDLTTSITQIATPANIKVSLEGFKSETKTEENPEEDDKDALVREYYANLAKQASASSTTDSPAFGDGGDDDDDFVFEEVDTPLPNVLKREAEDDDGPDLKRAKVEPDSDDDEEFIEA
ncbi:hypothetical protein HDU76_008626 [Blyttiomyces sp. JEL0837]|nr:hypothetical protein HDU76_008626 [Blyttiomyces sp. JEL0837]